MKINLFAKIYTAVLFAFVAIALSISYLISVQQISRIEKNELDGKKMIVDLISKEIEERYYENKWPYESLHRLSRQEETLFWWIVRDNDGLVYLADKSSFMGTHALDHYPQLAGMAGKEHLSINLDRSHAILVKHLDTGQTRWSFWYGFSLKEVAERKKELMLLVTAVSVSAVMVLGIILFFVIRHVTEPVKSLISGAAIIGGGDLAHRIKVETEDELGQLAIAFNKMADGLRDSQENLMRQERLAMLGRIAGNMGNELLNPLGVMSNAVFFLKNVMLDANETVREYLDIIRNEIDNSQSIISDLLEFYQVGVPSTEVVPAHELVALSLARCAIPENVQLRTDTPETPLLIRGDPKQMGQALCNLITNACQAMPEGGALRVAARRVSSSEFRVSSSGLQPETLNSKLETDFVEISVADTGVGIAPENLEKVFQPLFTTKSRGIGLGLAYCKKLVEANCGRIEVESALEKGTTFRVMLPVGSEKSEVSSQKENPKGV